MYLGPISDQTWESIRAEFTLPALEQVRGRLSEHRDDPEPVMQQLVRVFIGEGTFCPGFQFLPGGQLHPTVVWLFQRAMELKIPHNYFTAWMVTPSRPLAGSRPVDLLNNRPLPVIACLGSLQQKYGGHHPQSAHERLSNRGWQETGRYPPRTATHVSERTLAAWLQRWRNGVRAGT